MTVRRFSASDAPFERSPDQDDDIFTGDVVDQTDGAPVSIGYGRYGPHSELSETMLVDDVMIVLEGGLTVTADGAEVVAGPGDVVHMPKGAAVTIRAHEAGALTAYVTYPNWRIARD